MIHEGRNVGHGGSNGLVDWSLGEIAKGGPAEEGVSIGERRELKGGSGVRVGRKLLVEQGGVL